jgi:hypothetical protein
MPRLPIDYTRAVIYKIVCRDVSVTEKYVGSTTDLRKRKACHKSNCNNPNVKQYNIFVYQFIRGHGGFENWEIVLVEKAVDCSDSPTLHARERYWIESLHAELNKTIPTRKQKEYNELNRDKRKEWTKKYKEINKDKIFEQDKKYRELNRDNRKEYEKEYKEINKDKIVEYNRKYRELNRDIINEKKREKLALKKATVLN